MSLNTKILNLVSGIDDPSTRLEIARTIIFLFDVWLSGRVSKDEIVSSLQEIAYTIVSYKFPLMNEEEKRKKAREIAEDIFRSFRIESLYRTTFTRLKEKVLM